MKVIIAYINSAILNQIYYNTNDTLFNKNQLATRNYILSCWLSYEHFRAWLKEWPDSENGHVKWKY